jgi:hypothetical protein
MEYKNGRYYDLPDNEEKCRQAHYGICEAEQVPFCDAHRGRPLGDKGEDRNINISVHNLHTFYPLCMCGVL